MIVTTSREVLGRAEDAGFVTALLEFGVSLISDTCWCMLGFPVIGRQVGNIITNSAKYAHYGPGLTGKDFHFRQLRDCVELAATGLTCWPDPPDYLG